MVTVITDRFDDKPEQVHITENGWIIYDENFESCFTVDPEEFMTIWRRLHELWMNPDTRTYFSHGCDQVTMANVVGQGYSPEYVRTCLEVGVALKWVIKTSGLDNWCYALRPIRYEHLL